MRARPWGLGGPTSVQGYVCVKDNAIHLLLDTWEPKCRYKKWPQWYSSSGRVPEEGVLGTTGVSEWPWCMGLAALLVYKLGSFCCTPKGEKFPSLNVKLKIRRYMGASGSVKSAD